MVALDDITKRLKAKAAVLDGFLVYQYMMKDDINSV